LFLEERMVRSRVSRKVCAQIAGGALALVVGLGFAGSALAVNTVSTTVVGGTRTASIADAFLGPIPYSHSDVTASGTMVLTADDSSGTNAGWNVTVLASNFVYAGSYGGVAIPASNFTLTSAAAPSHNAGQGISPAQGPKVPGTLTPPVSLDAAHKVLHSNANHGRGNYSQNLGVSLVVPGDSVEGSYTSTLTVTIAAAP
jgi:hypothetical protein